MKLFRHILLTLTLSLPVVSTRAATLVVTNLADSGTGSLRQTILNALAGDTINFATNLSGATILITSGELLLNKSLILDASALTNGIKLNGGGTSRIFTVSGSTTNVLTALTITNGNIAGSGGGIYNQGKLTVNQCSLAGNVATSYGGGIENEGTLIVNQSTLTANRCSGGLGGGGIDCASGTLTINQSTISGNTATDNTGCGGIFIYSGTGTLSNSIVAGNIAPTTSNLVGIANSPANCNLIDIAPLLAPIGNYGGPTPTMPPLPGSPTIDGCTNGTSFATDQRGLSRIVGHFADIGAVEANWLNVVVTTTADTGINSLRDIITYFPSNSLITFATNLAGSNIILTNGQLLLNKNLAIDASALPGGIQINGNINSRLFEIATNATVALKKLTLTGGNGAGATATGNGGAIYNQGILSATDCNITNNTSTTRAGAIASIGAGSAFMALRCLLLANISGGNNGGGAIYADTSTLLQLTDCTFTGNKSPTTAGGIHLIGSSTGVLTRCTFSGNTSTDAGAVRNTSSTLSLVNCTIANNTGTNNGGGLYVSGNTTLTNCTIAGNTSPNGGGVRHISGTLVVENCIVAGNMAAISGPDIYKTGGTLTRSGHDFIGINTSVTTEFPAGAPNGAGDIVGTAGTPVVASLALLGNFGGPTPTQPPLPGSPVIDAGTDAGTNSFITDQRGFPRVFGLHMDIGAAEFTVLTPTLVTLPAVNVSANNATPVATVNPNNATTGYYFIYYFVSGGTTNISVSSQQFLSPGDYVATVTNQLTGLQPNTLYHFRVTATNGAGGSSGNDLIFSTPAITATVVTMPAVNLTTNGATLVATLNPNNAASGCFFEYGTTTIYGGATSQQFFPAGNYVATVTNQLTGLQPNTLYHFRLDATNTAGASFGNDVTFTTPAIPPTVVTLPAANLTTNTATFSATVNPNGTVTTYYFEYGMTTNYGTTLAVKNLPAVGTNILVSTNVTGLLPNTLYHFRAVAANSGGTNSGGDQFALLATCSLTVNANSQPVPAMLPNLKLSTAGEVYAMAVQPDGKIIIGGRFFLVNNIPRKNLARLNPNGSLDLTWNPPSPDYQPYAMALNGTDLYIAGEFRNVGDVFRPHVAKLTTVGVGALDPVWNPGSDNQVNTGQFDIAISGSWLYISGGFAFIGGQSRAGFARLNLTNGLADASWNPAPNGAVNAILASDTNIFVGGSFTSIGGQTRTGLAKFNSSTAIDLNWNPSIQAGSVSAMAVNGTNLFIGGSFTGIGGNNNITNAAKISTVGTGAVLAPAWVPNPNNTVTALAVTNGNVYLGGNFTTIANQPRQRLAKVNANDAGTLSTNWQPAPSFSTDFEPTFGTFDRSFISTLVATESAIFTGGNFKTIDGNVSLGVVRLDSVTGKRDATFPAAIQLPGQVYAITRQADGRLILGGNFLFADGLPRQNLARVNRDGSLDANWAPVVSDTVTSLALNGTNLFVGGFFNQVNGTNRNFIAKIDTFFSDALDVNWNASTNVGSPFQGVLTLALDGTNLYAGGSFSSLSGINRPYLARLSMTGSGMADPVWQPNANAEVDALAVSGTNVFVGGHFSSLNGVNRLAKLSTLGFGAADTNWIPNPTGSVGGGDTCISSLCVDGTNLFAGGVFTSVGGQTRQCLAKFNITGSGAAEANWNPVPSGNVGNFCNIRSLAVANSNLYFGGDFFQLGSLNPFFNGVARANKSGSGAVDLNWIFGSTYNYAWTYAIFTNGSDLYLGGLLNTFSGADHNSFLLLPSLAPPVVFQDGLINLFITRNVSDGPGVTYFMVTAIFGGTLFHNDGVTAINCGDFITASEAGAAGGGLKFNVGGTVTVAPALDATLVSVSPATTTYTMVTNPTPIFALSAENYSVREGDGSVVINVRKFGAGAAAVDYATAAITATSGVDYLDRSGRLSFGAAETVKTIFVSIGDDFVAEPDETFTFTLSLVPGANNPQLATPSQAFVTIADNDSTGGSDSLLVNQAGGGLPVANGALTVDLQPTNALGQWRLLGELNWHNGGDQIAGLVSGNYSVEFRPINGWFQPDATTVPIDGGITGTNKVVNAFTFYYTASTNSDAGNLTANIEPAVVATNVVPNLRGQWRRQGEAIWHDSGELIPANAGSYTVEYKDVAGRLTPTPQTVQVGGGNANYSYSATYLVAPVAPGAVTPVVVLFATASTSAPYLYNGQLQTSVGFASGVVVKPRVVLTVAHAVFDDVLLRYVTTARWFFERYRDQLEPVPQVPRGWYIFDGYAAQRGFDNSPDISTPASQNLDAAALYFLEDAGRGGFGGYLSADAAESVLLGADNKMLAGYPLDGVAETNKGKLFATPPFNVNFSRLYTSVFATTNIQSFPGNSGGPLYVQNYDGVYYPAGIFLGGSGQTLVRGIDSGVVDLIKRAEVSGNGGGNSTGGGAATLDPGVTVSPFGTGLLTVNMGPNLTGFHPGWRITGGADTNFVTALSSTTSLVGGGGYPIEFKSVPGFLTPSNRTVQIAVNQTATIQANYTGLRPVLKFISPVSLSFTGAVGAKYRVEFSTNLAGWTPLMTQTLAASSITITNLGAATNKTRFFRTLLLP